MAELLGRGRHGIRIYMKRIQCPLRGRQAMRQEGQRRDEEARGHHVHAMACWRRMKEHMAGGMAVMYRQDRRGMYSMVLGEAGAAV